jgi:hypothetical protein
MAGGKTATASRYDLELIVTADVGPRIIRFGSSSTRVFYECEDELAKRVVTTGDYTAVTASGTPPRSMAEPQPDNAP